MSDVMVSIPAMRLVRLLVGREPQSVADLIDAAGVTRTAVTEQLAELVAAGFVRRTTERHIGRGRPRHLFQATNAVLFLLLNAQEGEQNPVGPILWRAIRSVGGQSLVEQVIDAAASELAETYARRITATAPEKRLAQMAELLTDEGLVVEVEADQGKGSVVLRKRSCSLIGLFEDCQSVCSLDERVISKVVGQPVRRIACRHEGDACCVFELILAKQGYNVQDLGGFTKEDSLMLPVCRPGANGRSFD
ncbi:MAG: MarR family transcriptional regulator [Pirellulales bacterium]|nr:MarR family transcriptional regulator [Pirellulales bacterium]